MYGDQIQQALVQLEERVEVESCQAIWTDAVRTAWPADPVWFHGDVASGNLLTDRGRLVAVIDFGTCGVGDPACDALRASEGAAVRIEDYRETLRGHQVLHLVGKGNKPATMPLTVPVLRVVEACRRQRTDGPARPMPGLGQADRPTRLLPDGRPDR